jgi:hypothetical protein
MSDQILKGGSFHPPRPTIHFDDTIIPYGLVESLYHRDDHDWVESVLVVMVDHYLEGGKSIIMEILHVAKLSFFIR